MGTENLFHRRKAKQIRELARNKAKRNSYAKILIVCEGSKTEPNYFNELKDHLVLCSTNIIITGDCGSNPMSVFSHGLDEYKIKNNFGDPFDKVFFVFDKDTHPDYQETINTIKSAKPKNTFIPITSVPCFEYWILLHFVYTTKPYKNVGDNSCCDELINELQKYLSNYKKGDRSVFKLILPSLSQAKIYAAKAMHESGQNNNDNPSTKVYELVEYLESIKK